MARNARRAREARGPGCDRRRRRARRLRASYRVRKREVGEGREGERREGRIGIALQRVASCNHDTRRASDDSYFGNSAANTTVPSLSAAAAGAASARAALPPTARNRSGTRPRTWRDAMIRTLKPVHALFAAGALAAGVAAPAFAQYSAWATVTSTRPIYTQ